MRRVPLELDLDGPDSLVQSEKLTCFHLVAVVNGSKVRQKKQLFFKKLKINSFLKWHNFNLISTDSGSTLCVFMKTGGSIIVGGTIVIFWHH